MNIDTDKTILVTGASQGIGRKLAIHFARQCKELILMARNLDNLEETRRLVEEAGGTARVFSLDLSRLESIQEMNSGLGDASIDIIINNAADVTSKPFSETSLEEIDHLIQTNVTGVLQLVHVLLPRLNPASTIVNISSLAGYKSNPTQTVYSVSKTAVNGMSDALRADLGRDGHHVLNVALGSVALDDSPAPGQSSISVTLNCIQRAIESDEAELFMDPRSKLLMRLYAAFPFLSRMR